MSFSVLVIPEDPTKDQYVLGPIFSALMAAAGKPNAKVRVMTDPSAQGVDQVLDAGFLETVVRRYPMVDLFLLAVDRDGRPGREHSVRHHSEGARAHLRGSASFLGTCAHQEIEVWCLAGMEDLPRAWRWTDVRAEHHAKEAFYEPYASMRGLSDAPGDGREQLGREAAGRYRSIISRCPELSALEVEVRAAISGS